MYKVEIDGQTLYHPNLQQYSIENAILTLEVNKAGLFKFTIRQNHPLYSEIKIMESRITVYDDEEILFIGRVLSTKRGFYNEKQVTCEGELAFLLDTIIRPYDFAGSVGEYFSWIITKHRQNSSGEKGVFYPGSCTVTNNNNNISRSNTNYPNTFDELREKLLEPLGGYLSLRHEDGVTYIDYLQDFESENEQVIKFGENLIDLEDVIKGQDIATVLIPLGAYLKDENGNDTSERLTLEHTSEIGAVEYVLNSDAKKKFGRIEKVVVFEDVTTVEDLKEKAEEELEKSLNFLNNLKLTAIDLHLLNQDIEKFRTESYVIVQSKAHGLDTRLLVRKMELNLTNKADGTIEIGEENKTLSSVMAKRTIMDKLVRKYKGVWNY